MITFLNAGKDVFFTVCNNEYKRFVVKDEQYNEVKPKVLFNNKAVYIKKSNKVIAEEKLNANLNIEEYILSSMMF